MRRKMKLWRGLTAVTGILLCLSILMTDLLVEWSGQVNVVLGVTIPTTVVDGDKWVYPSEYGMNEEGLAAMLAASDAHDIQTMIEGAVLLKNNGALPLTGSETRVSLFGRASADPIYRGNSGGPAIDKRRLVTFRAGLEGEGLVINDKLFKAYEGSELRRRKAEPDWFIAEEGAAFYTADLQASWENDYHDAAIVLLSRDGGEGKDLAMSDSDGISHLALHETEKEMLKLIADSGKFSKTIVLINSAYPMEMDWIYDEQYGVDAALWIGTPGLKGFTGVAKVLTGKAAPSGRLVDTWAANSLSAPAVQNAGDFKFANTKTGYIVEAEGIYIGYRYYETRYYDQVLSQHNAASSAGTFMGEAAWNYAAEMTFPYGYGLSYANFTQELKDLKWNRTAHTVTAKVKVTNNGAANGASYDGAAKQSVVLYVNQPWEEGEAEKSAIQMIGFAKTRDLKPGESEEVTIVADDYLFATYDMNAENGADPTRKGCYVFDAGEYTFAIGSDAHDALNNVLALTQPAAALTDASGNAVTGNAALARTVKLDARDNTTYAISRETGNIVANLFESMDLNSWLPGTVTYLTRADWNTFPAPVKDVELTAEMKAVIENDAFITPDNAPAYTDFAIAQDHGIKFADMIGVAYDDPKWELFLDQLTLQQMTSITGENFGQPAIDSVSKPANANSDGPAGPQGNYRFGEKYATTVHVGEVVAAATWNIDLVAQRGSFIGEDCLFVGTTQLWSPGADLHRTPFSGRNFEYYSEDSVLSYLMSAAQTCAMQAKGVNAAIKHFVGNDQETNRTGLCTFATEQGFRQNSLKGFEGAFTKGGALGTMMSTNRIGLETMYQNAATCTGVLRDEWGFKGVTITDSVKGDKSVYAVACLVAGTDTFNADTGRSTELLKYLVKNKDGYVLQELRRANKNFYYAMAQSNLVNGLTREMVVQNFVPWWQYAMLGINIALGAFTALFAVLFVFSSAAGKKGRKA